MACTFEVFIPHEEARYAEHVARAAFDEVDRVEQELSRFIDHSDVARINALKLGQSLRLGMETFECLQLAAAIHRETDGAFDVTAGSSARTSGAPEDSPPEEGEDERPPDLLVGMQHLELDGGERTVTG